MRAHRALPILVIPPGNDADFEPQPLGALAADARTAEREAFTREFRQARALENVDPAAARASAMNSSSRINRSSPRRIFVSPGSLRRPARRTKPDVSSCVARDLDGLPLRCPSDFQEAYRKVAARHQVVLVDGPAILAAASPTGQLDNRMFHDGQHPTLRAYVALSADVVRQLGETRAFDLPRSPAVPNAAECLAHFGFDRDAWESLCRRSYFFWRGLAYIRYDPTERFANGARYLNAANALRAGRKAEDLGIPEVGIPRDPDLRGIR